MQKKFKENDDVCKVDSDDITSIMSNRPGMSNRDIVSVLSVLRGKLGRQAFKMNLKKAIAARSNLLEDYFQTEMTTFLNSDGQKISLPLTSLIDINVIVSLIC